MLKNFNLYSGTLESLGNCSLLITTLNAHSYNVAQNDKAFTEALQKSDILIPDGVSVVWAFRLLTGVQLKKIAGEDLFFYEMNRIETQFIECENQQNKNGKVFFLGSNESILKKIKERAEVEFPHVEVHIYSPPYKSKFTEEEKTDMCAAMFIGMTAPKQEKWAFNAISSFQLKIINCHVCCIGAVFDFYAGTVSRAPQWMIRIGLEWFYRLVKEPKRMWRRYLVGNVKFVLSIIKEKITPNYEDK